MHLALRVKSVTALRDGGRSVVFEGRRERDGRRRRMGVAVSEEARRERSRRVRAGIVIFGYSIDSEC